MKKYFKIANNNNFVEAKNNFKLFDALESQEQNNIAKAITKGTGSDSFSTLSLQC